MDLALNPGSIDSAMSSYDALRSSAVSVVPPLCVAAAPSRFPPPRARVAFFSYASRASRDEIGLLGLFGMKHAIAPSGTTSPGAHVTNLPGTECRELELGRLLLSLASRFSFFSTSALRRLSATAVRFSSCVTFAFAAFWSHITCFFRCLSKSNRVMYVIPQSGTSHLNGRSSVCSALMCTLSEFLELIDLPHSGHSNGFVVECVFPCAFRSQLL